MKPVDQTLMLERGEPGDCYRACIASIFELPIEDVPHFTLEACRLAGADVDARPFDYAALIPLHKEVTEGERRLTDEWLAARGKRLVWPMKREDFPSEGYCIVSGVSARDGSVQHACVGDLRTLKWDNDRVEIFIAHDPHPSRAGIREIAAFDLFIDIAENEEAA